MVATINGTTMASITICSKTHLIWLDELVTHLAGKGHQITQAETPDERADVVIITSIADSIEIAARYKSPRPLLILVSDEVPSGELNCIDVVLPPSPSHIHQQIKYMLDQKKENDQLQHDIDKLNSDIKQQQRFNDQVEVLKNAIVRNVSHELKTPLLQVKSAVALLAEDVDNEELINYAKNATARLETLVKNITLLGSSLDINPSPVIVRDALEYARRNIRRVWEHNDAGERIEVNIEPNLPPVLADKQGLSTVLQLLMDNALKFSKLQVEVSATRQDKIVKVAVRDSGIGIAEDQIKSIFQTFYQVDSSSTRRYGGMGIGLAIVQLILDGHNTVIHVDSEVNKGSTFWFSLPIMEI